MPGAELVSKIDFKNCSALEEIWQNILSYEGNIDYITWFTSIQYTQKFLPSEIICKEKINSTVLYLSHIN